jgi:hypothetical protein
MEEFNDLLVSLQKVFKLGDAPQELLASPDGSTVIEPPTEWPT